MSHETTTIFVDGLEQTVSYSFYWENDGIGSYEFWGAKGYDAGHDYIVIEDIIPIFTNETEEEKKNILKFIKTNFDDCSEQIEEKLSKIHARE